METGQQKAFRTLAVDTSPSAFIEECRQLIMGTVIVNYKTDERVIKHVREELYVSGELESTNNGIASLRS